MNKVYLLTGGNMGDREALLAAARYRIAALGTPGAVSGVYETAAWDMTDQPLFLNQALELHTSLGAAELMQALLKIEQSLGRIREKKFGPRLMDIDILLFNDEVIKIPDLEIPHPRMTERRFVLLPLAEIAQEQVHPVLRLTVGELLKRCGDELEVRRIS